MRIIGGTLAGRQIAAPPGDGTRPTADRVREAIFNRLAHGALEPDDGSAFVAPFDAPVLDLYAGSGAFGLEALSRGAPSCDFVELAAPACAVVHKNASTLGLATKVRVHREAADRFLKRGTAPARYGLVFADPPYAEAGARLDRALQLLADGEALLPGALVIVEHGPKPSPRAAAGEQPGLRLLDQRSYGQTVISYFLSSPDRGIRLPA